MSQDGDRASASRGQLTRDSILDAAEILFGQRGYEGTSTRDLAARAKVRLSLLHYHFGTKDKVLAATFDRKFDGLRSLIQSSFDTAAAGGELTLEECVRAFVMPFLEVSADKGHELHNFVVMTSHLMSSYRVPEVKPSLIRLSAISELFTTRVRAACPGAGESELLAGTYLIEAALIFMVQDPGFLDDISAHHHSADKLDQIAGATLRFFSTGLRSLIDPTSPN
ncbi:transcriptional regulator [Novosphingobium malaysiense]|uniref:Transcriptional regulator n=1 Tax=Novosphingobium malaysiense TaxID=1348853 RepID=A0A0B1ZWQ2_9SPHN|nr:transcriptional regulator [Novosphingobium malaysiense]